MWLLISVIVVWALSPGPVAVMTVHESRKSGLMSGVAISGGATITSLLMVMMAIVLHAIGFSTVHESDNLMMTMIERVGAFGIILMGLSAGYKSLWANREDVDDNHANSSTKMNWVQGMMVMATYIPQALVFYCMVIPQTVDPQAVISTIILLGTLKVILIFGWHAGIAYVATRSQNWMGNPRFGKLFEVATACLIMALGINILV